MNSLIHLKNTLSSERTSHETELTDDVAMQISLNTMR